MLTAETARSRPAAAWIDRLAPSAGPAVVIALAVFVGITVETGSPFAAGLVGSAALVLVGGVMVRRRSPGESSWTGGGAAAAPAFAARRAQPVAPARWRVVSALGRVEARELVCSPWFGVGVGFQIWYLLLYGVLYADEDNALWSEVVQTQVLFAHPMVGMLVVAAHAAATRARYDHTEELYESCPAGPTTRIAALLSTAWVAAANMVVFDAMVLVALAVHADQISGPAGADAIPDLLGTVALAVGGVVLGVAVGRWVRFRLAPVVAVVAVGFITLWLDARDVAWSALSTVLSVSPSVFVDRAAWWHLAWLVGLSTLVAGVALAGAGGDGSRKGRALRPDVLAGAVGLSVALVAAVMVTRPLSPAAAERLAARVGHPADHQACSSGGDGRVRVCAYEGYGELRDRVLSAVSPVAAALPPGTAAVTLRQVFTGSRADLPPEVRRRLPGDAPPLGVGEVALATDGSAGQVAASRLRVAFTALGLPMVPEPGDRPVVVAGQARGVVALWLAGRGLDSAASIELATADRRERSGPPPATADSFDRGYAWPDSCETAPVVWSPQDLAAARALLAQAPSQVMTVVHAGWDRWRDPQTPTDDLLAATGLAPVGPADRVETKDASSC